MNEFLLYLVLILDNVHHTLAGFTALSIIALLVSAVISLVCAGTYYGDANDSFHTPLKKSTHTSLLLLITVIVLGLVGTFLPTTQQAAVIYVVPKLLRTETTETLSRLPNKIALKLEKYVDDWATESLTKDGSKDGSKETSK